MQNMTMTKPAGVDLHSLVSFGPQQELIFNIYMMIKTIGLHGKKDIEIFEDALAKKYEFLTR